MSKVKLTERNKLTLPGGEREVNYADANFPGLFLRVTPANARAFVLRYSDNGRQRKRTIGRAEYLNVTDARKKARDFLADVESGVAQEAETQTTTTVVQLAKQYLSAKRQDLDGGELKERTLNQYRQQVRDYILPVIGSKQVTDVTVLDVDNVAAELNSTTKKSLHIRHARNIHAGPQAWSNSALANRRRYKGQRR